MQIDASPLNMCVIKNAAGSLPFTSGDFFRMRMLFLVHYLVVCRVASSPVVVASGCVAIISMESVGECLRF